MQRRDFEQVCEQKQRLLVLAVEVQAPGLIDRRLTVRGQCRTLFDFRVTSEGFRVEGRDDGWPLVAARLGCSRPSRR
jgi:hypothetical protein